MEKYAAAAVCFVMPMQENDIFTADGIRCGIVLPRLRECVSCSLFFII